MLARLLVVVLLLVSASVPARAWVVSLTGTPPDARPFGLATDAAGNVLTAGRRPSGSGTDGIAAKLAAADGSVVWQRTVTGAVTGNDIVRALLVDAQGNAIVIGQVANGTTKADALVAKLAAADGHDLWRRDIDGGTLGTDDARAGALLAEGDVVAAGSSPMPGNPDPITVWRFAGATGETVWTQRLPGSGGAAQRVAVAGSAVYVGAHVPVSSGTRITVARLDASTGAVLWNEIVTSTGNPNDELTGLVVSNGTQVVLSTKLHGGANAPNFVVVALDAASGDETWRVILDGGAIGVDDQDGAHALAVDAAGQIFATGILSNAATADDVVLVKLRASDGRELWRATVVGTSPGSEDARDVVIDGNGDAIIGARLRNLGTNGDLAAVKFAGATGTLVWQRSVDGTQHGSDTAFNVAVDAANHVAVAGRLRNGDQGDGYAVVRLSGTSGGSLPCGDGTPDSGEECDDGNPVAGDGCRTTCTLEVCGDGILDPQEGCDDGNTADGDCCSPTCQVQADQTPCDDGDACTEPDRCVDGVCLGEAPVVCPEAGPCELSFCDPEAGGCVLTVLGDGTRCDDGNKCTIADRCGDGVCIGGPPPFCDDDDPCTLDMCVTDVGCIHPAVASWESVLCVFERRTIPFECRNPLPVPLQKRLEKTELLLNVASVEQRPNRACRKLKRAGRMARKAQRFATRWRDDGLLPFHCGQAIVDEMVFLRARVFELRDGAC
ncbi:MAG TPA: PQQ-binding-like beta-propeller repeat protein [Candidatus Limnocylindria bacterium]|nr:PQQ-binding-like beta-propeller repeat protein [Candidatus Limnocylindria bacterium]